MSPFWWAKEWGFFYPLPLYGPISPSQQFFFLDSIPKNDILWIKIWRRRLPWWVIVAVNVVPWEIPPLWNVLPLCGWSTINIFIIIQHSHLILINCKTLIQQWDTNPKHNHSTLIGRKQNYLRKIQTSYFLVIKSKDGTSLY